MDRIKLSQRLDQETAHRLRLELNLAVQQLRVVQQLHTESASELRRRQTEEDKYAQRKKELVRVISTSVDTTGI
jgi:hypothetical protein